MAYHTAAAASALLLGGFLPFQTASAVRGPLFVSVLGGLGAERAALAGTAALGWAELGQGGDKVSCQ